MRYFLSRYNRFYAFVIHRRPVELYVSTAIVMGIIAAAWYVVCYRTATRSIVVAQRTIASCTGGAAALHKRQQQCKSAQDAIQDLKKALYARRGQGDVLQLSSDAAKAAGIVLQRCTLDRDGSQAECGFCATFDQVIIFLDWLASQPVPLLCTQLDMQGTETYEVRLQVVMPSAEKIDEKKALQL